jgi:hypothetical protein
MYHTNRLNVDVKSLGFDFSQIPGIKEAVQVFPDEDDPTLHTMYVVYVEPDKLEEVYEVLMAHPSINRCEKIPLRTIAK